MGYKKGHNFHGVRYRTPGTYSYVESDMRIQKANGAKNIAIIGSAKGGVPGKISFIEDPEDAKRVLKGGELLKACLKAYDPVIETKEGLRLGGADQILAIRANKALQAKTQVYQAKEVESAIGSIAKTQHKSSTGNLEVSGEYKGEENKTFVVTIVSEGLKELKDTLYKVSLADSKVFLTDDPIKASAEEKEIADGVSILFKDGTYAQGDNFLIPCTAKVTEAEFVYTIESKDYGEENNLISHKLEDGSEENSKKLTIFDGKSEEYEIFDNIGSAFNILYKGNAEYATLTITADGKGNAIKLQTFIGTSADDAIVDIDIDLDVDKFKSLRNLAIYLSGYADYDVEPSSNINYSLMVSDLDFYDKLDIKERKHITAVLRDLQKTTELQSELISVTLINREVSNYEDYYYTNLEGGSEGLEPFSYTKLLDELSKYDVDYIVPLTADLGIIAECRDHVIQMSERHGKERRLVCGAPIGQDYKVYLQNVKQLEHPRVQYFGPGFYDFDGKLYPGYMSAAMHAGRVAFLGVESATADIFNILKPEQTFSETSAEHQRLIDAGILFFDEVISDYDIKQFYSRLVWDYTTFSQYNDPLLVERSTGAIGDQVSKEIRKGLDKLLTGKLTPVAVLESAKNRVISILQKNQKEGVILDFRNVKVTKENDSVHVFAEVAPTVVTNFTFIDLVFYNEDIAV